MPEERVSLHLTAEQLHLLARLAGLTVVRGLEPLPVWQGGSRASRGRLVISVAARSLGARGLLHARGDDADIDPVVARLLDAIGCPVVQVELTTTTAGGSTTVVLSQGREGSVSLRRDRRTGDYVLTQEPHPLPSVGLLALAGLEETTPAVTAGAPESIELAIAQWEDPTRAEPGTPERALLDALADGTRRALRCVYAHETLVEGGELEWLELPDGRRFELLVDLTRPDLVGLVGRTAADIEAEVASYLPAADVVLSPLPSKPEPVF